MRSWTSLLIYLRSVTDVFRMRGPSQRVFQRVLVSAPSGEAFLMQSVPGIVTRTQRSCRGASLTEKRSY
eukprot:9494847-Pyramimonas_sp.AAC.1